MLGLVSNTDSQWFEYLSALASTRSGRLDEVNFWRPKSQQQLRIIEAGAPFFLRLKHPVNVIAGWGFFAQWHLLPFAEAWRLFEEKNGAPNFEAFRATIQRLRGADPAAVGATPIGCVVLREATLLPKDQWIPWGTLEGWSPTIVNDKSYDLLSGHGRRLHQLLANAGASMPPDPGPEAFQLLEVDARRRREQPVATRDGQGTFRSRLLEAYGSRCALTGERVVPVLEAAHIQDYLGPASNHIQNGLLLRADLHKLYDARYVTITRDYEFRVSERVDAEYGNGKDYYRLEREGAKLRKPLDPAKWPSRDALAWHSEKLLV